MTDTPLDTDALESAWKSTEEHVKRHGTLVGVSMPDIVEHAVSSYLANAQPVVYPDIEEVSLMWRKVSEAIDHEHLDPREFLDLGDLKYLLGKMLDSYPKE